jgi:hypothetical protein
MYYFSGDEETETQPSSSVTRLSVEGNDIYIGSM